MDQKLLIVVGVAVIFSTVSVAILLMKLPRRLLLIWSGLEAVLLIVLCVYLFFLQPA